MLFLEKIYDPEEQREGASKALRLNGGPDYNPEMERLLAASLSKKKPGAVQIVQRVLPNFREKERKQKKPRD